MISCYRGSTGRENHILGRREESNPRDTVLESIIGTVADYDRKNFGEGKIGTQFELLICSVFFLSSSFFSFLLAWNTEQYGRFLPPLV